MRASGLGSRQNIVGTGVDDSSDAVDRRVQFKVERCTEELRIAQRARNAEKLRTSGGKRRRNDESLLIKAGFSALDVWDSFGSFVKDVGTTTSEVTKPIKDVTGRR